MPENIANSGETAPALSPKKMVKQRKASIVTSDFHQKLTSTQQLFDEVNELDKDLFSPSPIQKATDVESMDKAVTMEISNRDKELIAGNTWVNDVTITEAVAVPFIVGQAIMQPLMWGFVAPVSAGDIIGAIGSGLFLGLSRAY